MRKQTVLLLIILLGAVSLLVVVSNGPAVPFRGLLAQVGVVVGVAPNPYNTLNEQLNQEKSQLDQQSSTLAAREAALKHHGVRRLRLARDLVSRRRDRVCHATCPP